MQEAKVRFIKLDPKAQVPTYGSEFAAGADLYAVLENDITIEPGQTYMIGTGIACEIPVGYAGLIYARSGLACKKGLAPANKVGVVDSDYRGEIKIALHNHGTSAQVVGSGERIAQLVITPFLRGVFEEVESLEETTRGEGGFGSSGRF